MPSGSGAVVVCIGGADVDRKFTLEETPPPDATSLVGRGVMRFGGVARNVAHNLVRLGVSARLVSLVGDDDDGRALLHELEREGVDVRDVAVVAGVPTAQYVAVLDAAGAVMFEIADMTLFERFGLAEAAAAWPRFAQAAWIVADANLRSDVLEALAARRPGGAYRLVVDAVSVPKARRLPRRLDGVDLLFLNEAEARAYLAAGEAAPLEAAALAVALRERGASCVVLTCGAAGLIVAHDEIVAALPAAPARRVVDVTGAGDALIAATLVRLLAGDDLEAALRAGVRAGARIVESDATVLPR